MICPEGAVHTSPGHRPGLKTTEKAKPCKGEITFPFTNISEIIIDIFDFPINKNFVPELRDIYNFDRSFDKLVLSEVEGLRIGIVGRKDRGSLISFYQQKEI